VGSVWRFRNQDGYGTDALQQQPTVFASPISTRSARLSRPLRRSPNGPQLTAQPPATPIPSLAGATLFPFLHESAASSASRPSRELLVNGRCPERLQGLVGSPYSRRKYSPRSRLHGAPPTLGIIGTVYHPTQQWYADSTSLVNDY
jgi:hypothetical protein